MTRGSSIPSPLRERFVSQARPVQPTNTPTTTHSPSTPTLPRDYFPSEPRRVRPTRTPTLSAHECQPATTELLTSQRCTAVSIDLPLTGCTSRYFAKLVLVPVESRPPLNINLPLLLAQTAMNVAHSSTLLLFFTFQPSQGCTAMSIDTSNALARFIRCSPTSTHIRLLTFHVTFFVQIQTSLSCLPFPVQRTWCFIPHIFCLSSIDA